MEGFGVDHKQSSNREMRVWGSPSSPIPPQYSTALTFDGGFCLFCQVNLIVFFNLLWVLY
ncbi:hypothetical protein Hdeb2414_s0017g00503951 [Helianthus debilis subsp. tardiflorus]